LLALLLAARMAEGPGLLWKLGASRSIVMTGAGGHCCIFFIELDVGVASLDWGPVGVLRDPATLGVEIILVTPLTAPVLAADAAVEDLITVVVVPRAAKGDITLLTAAEALCTPTLKVQIRFMHAFLSRPSPPYRFMSRQ
jgi:hypothetical protein